MLRTLTRLGALRPHPRPRVRRALAGLTLGALLGAPALADNCPPPPAQLDTQRISALRQQAQTREVGILWRISRNGVTSWLYGTVHALRPDLMFFGPQVHQALQGSRVLALELNPLSPQTLKDLGLAMQAKGAAMPPTLAEQARQALARECLPEQLAERIHPQLLPTLILGQALRRHGLEASFGAELALASTAQAYSMPIEPLETPAEQIAALLGPDPQTVNAEQLATDLQQLQDPATFAKLKELINAWARSDTAHLARYSQWCDCLNTDSQRAAFARMIEARNPRMAERIERLHAQGQPVFAAVGALHLLPPQALPDLLAQRGFSVQAIPLHTPPAPPPATPEK